MPGQPVPTHGLLLSRKIYRPPTTARQFEHDCNFTLHKIIAAERVPADSARCRPPFRNDLAHHSDDVARGDEASSGSDTVPPFNFVKGDPRDADGEVCDAPCARCDQIEVGRDADPRDCATVRTVPSTVRLTIRRFEAAGVELAVARRRH
jgi:hypothetical protein